ncbi:MAG: hypothetical protein QMC80_03515 [Thermoplasmatales archaeon]|nr:hypothetical protein [Thermoplasmatales archaeon]
MVKKSKEIEKLLKSEKLKVLKPNECGLMYDEKKGLLIGFCNKNGEIKITLKKKIEEI